MMVEDVAGVDKKVFGVATLIVTVMIVIILAFIAPGLGTHCLNETHCCNSCDESRANPYCFQYCDCPCDSKFDPFVDDPVYWFIERNLK